MIFYNSRICNFFILLNCLSNFSSFFSEDLFFALLNPIYLNPETQAEIQEKFEESSEISLPQFFSLDQFEKAAEQLRSIADWDKDFTPNRSCFTKILHLAGRVLQIFYTLQVVFYKDLRLTGRVLQRFYTLQVVFYKDFTPNRSCFTNILHLAGRVLQRFTPNRSCFTKILHLIQVLFYKDLRLTGRNSQRFYT